MPRSKEKAIRYENKLKPGDRQIYNPRSKKLRESNLLTWEEVNMEKRNEVINEIIDQLKNPDFSEVKSDDVEKSITKKLKAWIYEGMAENRAKKNASSSAATPAPKTTLPYDPVLAAAAQQKTSSQMCGNVDRT
ncbi:hypothetical protein COCSADRAFT_192264 [Bipolaris sorokiniana ND90Pr]|uniref:Uncharacterized protein n=1 Tax=Cochliobolus sativus (strain ND90Pr / ATCC 201652) TaxID=665912 RepID=M2S228_COCSN|nr:uncharacterized protein COCSADRAFT_192264 [Bipolaris sorokiniana ND90Pr]EMD61278.1 hypothetical protein COCSADRAFT_192264 [Bipolaris sorokiniana ND90Pr]